MPSADRNIPAMNGAGGFAYRCSVPNLRQGHNEQMTYRKPSKIANVQEVISRISPGNRFLWLRVLGQFGDGP